MSANRCRSGMRKISERYDRAAIAREKIKKNKKSRPAPRRQSRHKSRHKSRRRTSQTSQQTRKALRFSDGKLAQVPAFRGGAAGASWMDQVKECLNEIQKEPQSTEAMKVYAAEAARQLDRKGLAHLVVMAAGHDNLMGVEGVDTYVEAAKAVLDRLDAIAVVAGPWYLPTRKLIRYWSEHMDEETTQALQKALADALSEHDTGAAPILPAELTADAAQYGAEAAASMAELRRRRAEAEARAAARRAIAALQRTLNVLRVFDAAVGVVSGQRVVRIGVDLTLGASAQEASALGIYDVHDVLNPRALSTFLRNDVRAICKEISQFAEGKHPFLIPTSMLVNLLQVLLTDDKQPQFATQNWLSGSMYFVGDGTFVDITAIVAGGSAADRIAGAPATVRAAEKRSDIKMRFNYNPLSWNSAMNIIVPLFADFLTANKETSIMFKFDLRKPDHKTQCGKQFDFYLTNTRSLTSFLETCKVAVAQFKSAGFRADPCRMAVISRGTIATRSLNKAEYNKSLEDNKLREGAFLKNESKWEYVAIPQPTQERVGLFFRLDQLIDAVYVVHRGQFGTPTATEMYTTLLDNGQSAMTLLEFLRPEIEQYVKHSQNNAQKRYVAEIFENFKTSALANVRIISTDPPPK